MPPSATPQPSAGPDQDAAATSSRVFASAFWALRTYRGSALLLVATCGVGLAASLVVTTLVARHGTGMAPRIALPPIPDGDYGVAWSAFADSPADIRRAAVAGLLDLLLGVALGVLAAAGLTTLAVSTARADAREAEIGVRRSVGASRRTLFRTALAEGMCLSLLSFVIGCGAGLIAAHVAAETWPGTARSAAIGPSLVAGAVTSGCIMLGALFPLMFARRSSQIAAAESTPVGLAVPAAQLGLSLAVLAAASLLNRGAARAGAPGAGTASGAVARIASRDSMPVRAAEYAALLRRLHADDAEGLASLANPGALSGLGVLDVVWSPFSLCSPALVRVPLKGCWAAYYAVSADSFQMLGLHLVAGRALSDADDLRAPRVAVISRALAFPVPPRDVVGLTIHVAHQPTPYTVVGVVDDQPPVGLGGGFVPRRAVYLSVLQHAVTPADLLVRTRGGPTVSAAAMSRALAETFSVPAGEPPRTTVAARASEAGALATDAAPLRWFGQLFTAEGWAVLAIATAGTFAMMWLWVASLEGELAVRRAVGARRWRVMGYVLARALLVAAGGVACGSWLGMMVWGGVGDIVAGLPAWDPANVARLGVLLATAALAGAWLPAWRATHTPPARLLAAQG